MVSTISDQTLSGLARIQTKSSATKAAMEMAKGRPSSNRVNNS